MTTIFLVSTEFGYSAGLENISTSQVKIVYRGRVDAKPIAIKSQRGVVEYEGDISVRAPHRQNVPRYISFSY